MSSRFHPFITLLLLCLAGYTYATPVKTSPVQLRSLSRRTLYPMSAKLAKWPEGLLSPCDHKNFRYIMKAKNQAISMLGLVLDELHPSHPSYKAFIRPSNSQKNLPLEPLDKTVFNYVKDLLINISKLLATDDGPEVYFGCGENGNKPSQCNDEKIAVTLDPKPGPLISFCPRFFDPTFRVPPTKELTTITYDYPSPKVTRDMCRDYYENISFFRVPGLDIIRQLSLLPQAIPKFAPITHESHRGTYECVNGPALAREVAQRSKIERAEYVALINADNYAWLVASFWLHEKCKEREIKSERDLFYQEFVLGRIVGDTDPFDLPEKAPMESAKYCSFAGMEDLGLKLPVKRKSLPSSNVGDDGDDRESISSTDSDRHARNSPSSMEQGTGNDALDGIGNDISRLSRTVSSGARKLFNKII